MDKEYVIIDGKIYLVSYPACDGCENLCFPAPLTCLYPGDGCEYPQDRVAAEHVLGAE